MYSMILSLLFSCLCAAEYDGWVSVGDKPRESERCFEITQSFERRQYAYFTISRMRGKTVAIVVTRLSDEKHSVYANVGCVPDGVLKYDDQPKIEQYRLMQEWAKCSPKAETQKTLVLIIPTLRYPPQSDDRARSWEGALKYVVSATQSVVIPYCPREEDEHRIDSVSIESDQAGVKITCDQKCHPRRDVDLLEEYKSHTVS